MPLRTPYSRKCYRRLTVLPWKGIVHRDVKPENILYISQQDGQYQFQLGDFGFCNRIVEATTFAGSHLYMGPRDVSGRGSDTQSRRLVTLRHEAVDIGYRRVSLEVQSI